VPEVTELTWLLLTVTNLSWLEKCHAYKDKKERGVAADAGLFTYPVLMAADILLYDTAIVPVGEDQKQHVELVRDIAVSFNHRFGEVFRVPEPVIREVGARVMGLDDPTKKMSKSSDGQFHSVGLLDDEMVIQKKFARAVTDSQQEILFDETRPGVMNLLTIHQSLSGQTRQQLEAHFAGKGYGDLKKELATLVVDTLAPIQQRYAELTADPQTLDRILADGAERARAVAGKTMSRVRLAMGFR
jgi:tryptophanyl-tRNA synthetase